MFAYGIGCRQFATRIALYFAAKDARSADVVPGIPLASDAPGAPDVDPPIAVGHVGVAGGGGGVGDEVIDAGVVVYVCPAVTLVDFTEVDAAASVCVGVELAESFVTFVETTSAGAALPPSNAETAVKLLPETDVLATMSALARVGAMMTDGPPPWIRITAATTAVARTIAFFNVCTPIQRLRCPPN
jgi:hypothetical protein